MAGITMGVVFLTALALLWTSAAKLLGGGRLAESPEMAWATRPGLASGTIAGVAEFVAAVVLVLTAVDVLGNVLPAVVAAVGVGAHMGAAATRGPATEGGDDAAEASRMPNYVIAALALLAAVLLLLG